MHDLVILLLICLRPSSKRDKGKAAIKIRVRLRVGIVKGTDATSFPWFSPTRPMENPGNEVGTDAYEFNIELRYEFFSAVTFGIGQQILNWRRLSTVEVPGLTEKFKSMRISPLTSKYYKRELYIFDSLRRRVFLSVGWVWWECVSVRGHVTI